EVHRQHSPPMPVIAVAFHAIHFTQAVAEIEAVALPAPAHGVPLRVVAHAGDHRPATATGADSPQATTGAVAIVVVAGPDPTNGHPPDVVQHVVCVVRPSAAVHCRFDPGQPVQAVVG